MDYEKVKIVRAMPLAHLGYSHEEQVVCAKALTCIDHHLMVTAEHGVAVNLSTEDVLAIQHEARMAKDFLEQTFLSGAPRPMAEAAEPLIEQCLKVLESDDSEEAAQSLAAAGALSWLRLTRAPEMRWPIDHAARHIWNHGHHGVA